MSKTVIMATSPHETLVQACDSFLHALRESGASEDQIEAVKVAFYLGAAQVYTTIDYAAKTDSKTFTVTMGQMFNEIDAIMTCCILSCRTEGNA